MLHHVTDVSVPWKKGSYKQEYDVRRSINPGRRDRNANKLIQKESRATGLNYSLKKRINEVYKNLLLSKYYTIQAITAFKFSLNVEKVVQT